MRTRTAYPNRPSPLDLRNCLLGVPMIANVCGTSSSINADILSHSRVQFVLKIAPSVKLEHRRAGCSITCGNRPDEACDEPPRLGPAIRPWPRTTSPCGSTSSCRLGLCHLRGAAVRAVARTVHGGDRDRLRPSRRPGVQRNLAPDRINPSAPRRVQPRPAPALPSTSSCAVARELPSIMPAHSPRVSSERGRGAQRLGQRADGRACRQGVR